MALLLWFNAFCQAQITLARMNDYVQALPCPRLVRRGDTMAGDIQVALTAISAAGKVIPAQHFKLALALTSDAYDRARTQGLRVLSELGLAPGRYQLRVAAGNVNGPAGAVMHDEIKIPAVDVVLADELCIIRFVDGALQRLALANVFTAHVDIACMRPHREGREQRSFDEQMRIVA